MKMMRTMSLLVAMILAGGVAWANCGHCEGDTTKTQGAAHEGHACCDTAKAAGMTCSMCNPDAKAEIGKPALNFKLKDAEGKAHQLSDFKGKVVVLSWTNPACPFIVDHNKRGTLSALADKYKDQDVAVLQIDSSKDVTAEKALSIAKEFNSKVPTLLDPKGKVGQMYGAKSTPHVFVIDKEGKLAYAGALDNAPMGKTEDGAAVVNYADQAVSELLAGKAVSVSSTKSYGCSVKYAEAGKAMKQKLEDKAHEGMKKLEKTE